MKAHRLCSYPLSDNRGAIFFSLWVKMSANGKKWQFPVTDYYFLGPGNGLKAENV